MRPPALVWLWAMAVVSWSAGVEAVAVLDFPTAPSGGGMQRGVAEIVCATERPRVALLSRGAILASPGREPRGDVILTTAHGLSA